MKPISATLIGVALAGALALAATAKTPEDIAARVVTAQDEQAIAATWRDWHPKAVHTITVKYGLGQKDDTFSYAIADLAAGPAGASDPELAEAMRGYNEIKRSAPEISSAEGDDGTRVTTVTRVDYMWQGITGTMIQTDELLFVPYFGASVIRTQNTIYDYR